MMKFYYIWISIIFIFLAACMSGGEVTIEDNPESNGLAIITLETKPELVEVGGETLVNCYVTAEDGRLLEYNWQTSAGRIKESDTMGNVVYSAPRKPGNYIIAVQVSDGVNKASLTKEIEVAPVGESSPYSKVLITVDTNTLKGVYVDETHPDESFVSPLSIKGELTYDESTGEAAVGGSWPTNRMYDDGTHGDKRAKDGIWSIEMTFEKSDQKVHFAFDDGNEYRVGFESGLTKKLKDAWIFLDDYPMDNTNPAFQPNKDRMEVSWNKDFASKADSVLNIENIKLEDKGSSIKVEWPFYASFYGNKAESYTVYYAGPFDDKVSSRDIEYTVVEGLSENVFTLDDVVSGKYYYFKVAGIYKGADYECAPKMIKVK